MAHWNSKTGTVVRWPAVRDDQYPGWLRIDCGCCNGYAWGGTDPSECWDCSGSGWLSVHAETGTLALYPGGPLVGGRATEAQLRHHLREVEAIAERREASSG